MATANNKTTMGNVPDLTVTRFNYLVAQVYFPQMVKSYNDGIMPLLAIFDIEYMKKTRPEYSQLLSQMKISLLDTKNEDNVVPFFVTIPSSQLAGETDMAAIIFDESKHKASYYTLEFSIGCKMICGVSGGIHFTVEKALSGKFSDRVIALAKEDFNNVDNKK